MPLAQDSGDAQKQFLGMNAKARKVKPCNEAKRQGAKPGAGSKAHVSLSKLQLTKIHKKIAKFE